MAHIEALITLLNDIPAPKSGGVKSGYDPHHKFPGVDYLATGLHTYPDDDIHYPGETLLASIVFPSWEFFGAAVKPGDVFEIRELDRLVGYGTVQSVPPSPDR